MRVERSSEQSPLVCYHSPGSIPLRKTDWFEKKNGRVYFSLKAIHIFCDIIFDIFCLAPHFDREGPMCPGIALIVLKDIFFVRCFWNGCWTLKC